MKELALDSIKRASEAGSIERAATIMAASRRVSFCIKTAEPNVIYYWSEKYGMSGSISF